jgi:hypothetical protein
MKMKIIGLLALLGTWGLLGCGEDKNLIQSGMGEIRMLLVDGPTTGVEAVNRVVTEVSVHQAGLDTVSGWTVIDNTTRSFDLMTLTNGASAVLGDKELSPGHYTQIRLKLGAGSTVVVKGESHPLEVPSGAQTGLKLTHEFDIAANTLYELMVDFDAARSIHATGQTYKMAPTLRIVAKVNSGTLSGTVSPVDARALVTAVVGTDTVSTAADTANGAFKLMALPAGTYTVQIAPSTAAYQDTTLAGVVVVVQQNTPVGTIVLHP